MKLSDYVFDFLAKQRVSHVFTVSGGGIAPLLDSLGRNPNLQYFCNYHEQACAVAAEGYARITGKPAVCLVTTGPGAVNALSGILGAWHDSLPVLVISGQVRIDLVADYGKVRQRGPQEGNIIEMVRGATKYAVSVREPLQIRFELEKALQLAMSGRPGPVWIELPMNVQGAQIAEDQLRAYTFENHSVDGVSDLVVQTQRVLEMILAAERPLVLAGNGIQLSQSRAEFQALVERFKIPVAMPYTAKDLLPEAHPMNIGVFGTCGQRRANFAVQNADLIVSLGAGLCVSKLGFNYQGFAPKAKKIIVDIDPGQALHQVPPPDLPVISELKAFLDELLRQSRSSAYKSSERWLDACEMWKRRYPIILDEHFEDKNHVNMYVFMDRLADVLGPEAVLVTGNGLDVVSCYQAFKVKAGQRILLNGNWGSMGWDLPMAIGACLGAGGRPLTVVTGDGSLQCNLQELLTIKYYRLPIKLFVYSNQGYGSIRTTQKSLFDGRLVGADPSSGVGCLDLKKLADLYDLEYVHIKDNEAIAQQVRRVKAANKAVLCEVNLSPEQAISPKASAFRRPDGSFESRPLEDMAPFLPREEVTWNMQLFDQRPAPELVPAG